MKAGSLRKHVLGQSQHVSAAPSCPPPLRSPPKAIPDPKRSRGSQALGSTDDDAARYERRNIEGQVSIDIQFEAPAPVDPKGYRSTNLSGVPRAGGVQNATPRFDLPPPAVAVRNLIEHAGYGHLCTKMSGMHHRRAGYPFGTVVNFATDGAGYPIFCLSSMAIHSRNLIEEPRCSLVVQMLGWTGLANARATIFGEAYQLPASMQTAASELFAARHTQEGAVKLIEGNQVYYRMHKIADVYFVGGFGTVQWIRERDYLSHPPDDVVVNDGARTLRVLTDMFSEDLKKLVAAKPVDSLEFIAVDAGGTDIRVRIGSDFNICRFNFEEKVHNLTEVVAAMEKCVNGLQGCASFKA